MSGIYGADVSTPVSAAQWGALMNQNAVSLGVVRCYESGGNVDPNAASTINQGWAAGLTRVDVYHFPCVSVSAEAQIQAAVQALFAANANFGYYWIAVEQGAGWSPTDPSANAQFLSQLIAAAQSLGLTVGIYTSPYEWSLVINSNAYSQYPLWYAEYDDQASFSGFVSFGGWTQPVMKQFAGKQNSAGICFDGNWAPALPSLPTHGTGQSPAQIGASSSSGR